MKVFPVALALEGRRVLVVGGGNVATRKVVALVDAGALVTVVSPELAPDFPAPIEHLARPFREGDCQGFALVFAATNVPEVNRLVAQEAKAQGILVNDASDGQESDFHTQAVVRRGPITIGISTGSASPVVSAHLKREVEAAVGDEWSQLFAIVAEVGEPEKANRRTFWKQVFQEGVLDLLRKGDTEGVRALLKQIRHNLP